MTDPPAPRGRRDRLAWRLSAHEEKIRRADLPLFGLDAQSAPVPRMLGDTLVLPDGQVDSVALCYGDPLRAAGPLVQVHSTRPGTAPTLSSLLVRELRDRDAGEAAVVAATAAALEDAHLLIDEEPRTAVRLRGGSFWAARCLYQGAVVSVVARAWEPSWTNLVSVTDVEPFLTGRRRYLETLGEDGPPAREPGTLDIANGPRALVNMVLELHAAWDRRWRERGGGDDWWAQRPVLPREWTRRWEAATLAQMRLAEQAREAAMDELWSMINQLTRLHDAASWWGNRRLREAAISETLLYYSGLTRDVPSRTAQDLWRRAWQAHVDGRPPSSPEALAELAPLVATARLRQQAAESVRSERACIVEWDKWARHHGWQG